jgi:hypothetical protein
LVSNENGSFASTAGASSVTFTGSSGKGYGTVAAVCDSTGRLTSFTYTGEFQ